MDCRSSNIPMDITLIAERTDTADMQFLFTNFVNVLKLVRMDNIILYVR